ncbi:MAG TPA: hypothetical protein PK173_01625 [Dokdonella sp.]|nr:hypothetical protein [Dokdonella sp.]
MERIFDPRVVDSNAEGAVDREVARVAAARRKQAGIDADPHGAWGLALSGGGIRSATFCLGLVRGLAKNKLLRQIDFLSTVSGGGYLGTSLGRLYGEGADAKAVEAGVASNNSMWLWWLRNNGRYLTPAGAKDLVYATASIFRGVIATHLEIGILLLLLGCLVLLPHVLVALYPPLPEITLWNYAFISVMPSAWAWLLPIPVLFALHQIIAYWYSRDTTPVSSMILIVVIALASCALSWVLLCQPWPPKSAFRFIFGLLALAPATAMLGSIRFWFGNRSASEQRLMRTKRLAGALTAVALVAILALLDWSTWQLTQWINSGDSSIVNMYSVTGVAFALTALGRFILPLAQRWMATVKSQGINVERMLNLLGFALVALLVMAWTTALSTWIFTIETQGSYWPAPMATLFDVWPAKVLLGVFATCLFYAFFSRRSFDLLNLATLHNFYRARIERAYASSGNSGTPESRFPESALAEVSSTLTAQVAPLTEAIRGDDIDIEDYRPQDHGGPVHLINCCINQSIDDRTDLYSADRKGIAIAVSSLGIEVGSRLPLDMASTPHLGKLSKWTAISGAAVSTGMGSRTASGLAALLFMSGIRLGYWMERLLAPASTPGKSPRWARILDFAPKPLAIVAECFGRFPGLSSPIWYLSDGGHFDNTAIHALLKRRARIIIAADCGADPSYLFADLESLVRKAKIDFDATIEFLDSESANDAALAGILGTPESISPDPGSRWLVLGRIRYCDDSIGTLLLVKPRRLESMPFDMLAYADRNPNFPQQTTGDQFFDEAQWESYHQLGLLLGRQITQDLVNLARSKAQAVTQTAFSSLSQQTVLNAETEEASTRRQRAGMSLRTTVGAGISLSLLIAAWQGFVEYRKSLADDASAYEDRVETMRRSIRDATVFDSIDRRKLGEVIRESRKRADHRDDDLLDALSSACTRFTDPSCPALTGSLELHDSDYWFQAKLREVNPPTLASMVEIAATNAVPHTVASPPSEVSSGTDEPAGDQVVKEGAAMTVIAKLPHDILTTSSTRPETTSPNARLGSSIPAEGVPPLAESSTTAAPGASLPADAAASIEGTSTDPSASAPSSECKPPVRLYVHIYDEVSRPLARALGQKLAERLHAPEPSIENVVSTAQRNGRRTPYVWDALALVYPAGSQQACVQQAAALAHELGLNASSLRKREISFGTPDVFELWLPPLSIPPVAAKR